MSSNVINQVAFLRTSREFPEELHQLVVEINKTYLDIANAVNARTIGIFPVNRPAQTGDAWFFTSSRQSSLRQVFAFGAITAGSSINIPYKIFGFNRLIALFGAAITDAPDQRPIPYAATNANSNISVRLDTANTQIIISVGSGSPNVVSGQVVFEWLSQA